MYSGDEHGRKEANTRDAATAGAGRERCATDTSAPAVGGDDLSGAETRPAPVAATLDPKLYTVRDEPLSTERVVDYRYLYELVHERLAREEDRGKSLDGKLATLLTGVVAAIGFSFRPNPTVVTTATAFLYLIPLILIAATFTTRLTDLAPDIESLERSFPPYPVSTMIEAIRAVREAHLRALAAYDRKASRLDHAVVATLFVTSIALFAQILVAFGWLR